MPASWMSVCPRDCLKLGSRCYKVRANWRRSQNPASTRNSCMSETKAGSTILCREPLSKRTCLTDMLQTTWICWSKAPLKKDPLKMTCLGFQIKMQRRFSTSVRHGKLSNWPSGAHALRIRNRGSKYHIVDYA